jgi:hypothetical protein
MDFDSYIMSTGYVDEQITALGSGIKAIQNAGSQLIFTLNDNSTLTVTITGLSDNNYTTADKNKLSSLNNTLLNKFTYVNNQLLFDEQPISGTVDLSNYYNKAEVNGLLLSKASISDVPTKVSELTNDSNFADKVYVDTQDATKANVNHIHTISNINDLQNQLDNRYTKLESLSKSEVQTLVSSISKGMNWKESVTLVTDLPTIGNIESDTRIVTSTTTINVWNGTTWIAIGSSANIPMATPTINGQMSMEDKAKLDSIVLENLVTIVGGNITIGGDILATTNGLQNIGSPTNRFGTIYVNEAKLSTNTLYIGDTPVLGTSQDTIMIKADLDQSLTVKTTGVGTTKVISGSGVELSTSGMNANINVQATGVGSNANVTATNEVNLTAPRINITGEIGATGDTTVGNLTVGGNLVINGSSLTVESTTVRIEDNIIELNKNEVGTGVTAGKAGLKINRGDADAYLLVFDETDDNFKVGTDTVLKAIATQDYVNSNTHTHTNKAVLDKFTEVGGQLYYNGSAMGGGTGTPTYFAEEW